MDVAAGIIVDALGRTRDGLHRTLGDVTPEELTREPHPPIGWLAWRLTRIQDSNFSRLAGLEQAWIADGWHARFNMEPNARDFGPGVTHTREQVAAFKAGAQLLLDYHDAVYGRSRAYAEKLTAEDLARELDEPQYDPRPTVAVRLLSVIENGLQNLGQMGYLKLLHRIGGWFPVETRPPAQRGT